LLEGAGIGWGRTSEESQILTWTNTEDKSLEAYFFKLDGNNVVLCKEDGSEFAYPMSLDNKTRIQYEGAVYHVVAREDRPEQLLEKPGKVIEAKQQ